MYNHTLHHGKTHFCRYCLQAFSTDEMLKHHIKDCPKINGAQRIKMSKKGKYVLGKDTVYNFINNMIKESKYCNEVMKKHFHKELVMTKEDNEDFKNSTKYWICDNN